MNRLEEFKKDYENAVKINNEYIFLRNNKQDVRYGVKEGLEQFVKESEKETNKYINKMLEKEVNLKERTQKLADKIKNIKPEKMINTYSNN